MILIWFWMLVSLISHNVWNKKNDRNNDPLMTTLSTESLHQKRHNPRGLAQEAMDQHAAHVCHTTIWAVPLNKFVEIYRHFLNDEYPIVGLV